jgi:hypothetical protein
VRCQVLALLNFGRLSHWCSRPGHVRTPMGLLSGVACIREMSGLLPIATFDHWYHRLDCVRRLMVLLFAVTFIHEINRACCSLCSLLSLVSLPSLRTDADGITILCCFIREIPRSWPLYGRLSPWYCMVENVWMLVVLLYCSRICP